MTFMNEKPIERIKFTVGKSQNLRPGGMRSLSIVVQ